MPTPLQPAALAQVAQATTLDVAPVPVVVIDEHRKDPRKVLLVQNQQPVEAFRADGAHEAVGNAVGLRRTKRRPNDLDSVAWNTYQNDS